jgi:hypothetical protein
MSPRQAVIIEVDCPEPLTVQIARHNGFLRAARCMRVAQVERNVSKSVFSSSGFTCVVHVPFCDGAGVATLLTSWPQGLAVKIQSH